MARTSANPLFNDDGGEPPQPPRPSSARQQLGWALAVEKQRRDRLTRLQAGLQRAREEMLEVAMALEQRTEILEQSKRAQGKRAAATLIGDKDPFPGLLSVAETEALVKQAQLKRRELEEAIEALQRAIGPGSYDCALAQVASAEIATQKALVDVIDEDPALPALSAALRDNWRVDLEAAAVFRHLSPANLLPRRWQSDAEFARRLQLLCGDHGRQPQGTAPLVLAWQAALARLQAGEIETPLPVPG
jgi:hypothetical protein